MNSPQLHEMNYEEVPSQFANLAGGMIGMLVLCVVTGMIVGLVLRMFRTYAET